MVRHKRVTIGAFLAAVVAHALMPVPRYAAHAQVPPESVLQLTAGDDHVCALLASGAVHCWGRNDYGQAGDGTYVDLITPAAVVGIPAAPGAIRQIDANGYTSCALTDTSAVYCWGNNSHGQLGVAATTTSTTSARLVSPLPPGIVQISVGDQHVCALDTDSKVWCWGKNNAGQLGRGTTGSGQPAPGIATRFEALLGNQVKRIAAGGDHTCVLTTAGLVWCVGNSGLSGMASTTEVSQVLLPSSQGGIPTALSGVSDVVSKVGHTCALSADSTTDAIAWVRCWGQNGYGQGGVDIGQLTALPYAYGVSTPSAGSNLQIGAVSMSFAHTCATINIVAHCWGSNAFGKLGINSSNTSLTHVPSPAVVIPTVQGSNRRALDFALGYNFTCARTDIASTTTGAATVYCWGQNDYGQIGRPKSTVETVANAIVFTTQQISTPTPRPPTATAVGVTPTPRPTRRRFLPITLAELGTETEDNDTGASADELPVNKLLTGRFDDTFDVFVTRASTGTLLVSVSGVTAAYTNQVQLQIYRGLPGPTNRVDEATAAPFVVTVRGADTYYIVVYSARPQASQAYQILARMR
jgi:alpha-tubulin suppressor-like RCC1 family protein